MYLERTIGFNICNYIYAVCLKSIFSSLILLLEIKSRILDWFLFLKVIFVVINTSLINDDQIWNLNLKVFPPLRKRFELFPGIKAKCSWNEPIIMMGAYNSYEKIHKGPDTQLSVLSCLVMVNDSSYFVFDFLSFLIIWAINP